MRRFFIILLIVLFLIIGLAYCRARAVPEGTTQFQTVPVQTPFATVAPISIITPTAPSAAPVTAIELPAENSEWYIDGWAEDVIVVSIYGREIRFDLAELRNTQTHVAIVAQCIDPDAKRPNLDFTPPVEQRDRFIYKANQFWHTTDPSVQRFIFIRPGELQ
jgi:hypothetical protein